RLGAALAAVIDVSGSASVLLLPVVADKAGGNTSADLIEVGQTVAAGKPLAGKQAGVGNGNGGTVEIRNQILIILIGAAHPENARLQGLMITGTELAQVTLKEQPGINAVVGRASVPVVVILGAVYDHR